LLTVSVIYNICQDWDLDFVGMFACTGLWNSFFLLIYAFTDASNLMKWCSRSVAAVQLSNNHFYRAMLCRARLCYGNLSVCLCHWCTHCTMIT